MKIKEKIKGLELDAKITAVVVRALKRLNDNISVDMGYINFHDNTMYLTLTGNQNEVLDVANAITEFTNLISLSRDSSDGSQWKLKIEGIYNES